ncbi:hypothetical protein O7627_25755 [Solwaraspora sp. WMMD1047]|uniref:hypothetical protein n=1 Tax=Solwaraspora sp. WMMD1047 TaxID=3016102 RepID=UPI002417992F|nr:hypothetical protein [Solwaraspora sp. WMMD1047]MDG4832688.1 hypothetical protein [Solwaraspora sp. WMMD1047]
MDSGTESSTDTVVAPPVEGAPRKRNRTPMVTSRRVWAVVYLITAVALLLRSTGLPAYVRAELDRRDASRELTDQNLENLAVNSGIFLGILLSLFVLALYYSLASALERHIFRPAITVAGRTQIGLFFLVAALCTLPVQVVSLVFGISSPRNHAFYQGYVIVAAVVATLLFRRHWIGRPKGKITFLFVCTLTLAILSSAT